MLKDVLQELSITHVLKLTELYRKHLPRTSHAYNFLITAINWKKLKPDEDYIIILVPHGDWKKGTFVGINQYSCYEVFASTLEDDNESLYLALKDTRKIKWNVSLYLYDIQSDLNCIVRKALEKTTFQFHEQFICDLWWMPYKKALQLEINCPPEVYIDRLSVNHASTINTNWPHKYEASEMYIRSLIEMNGGYGVFLQANGMLVAWIIRVLFGLGILQTLDGYKRKGYGGLVLKMLSKEIAIEGLDPMGSVLKSNTASQKMFKKAGFEILESVTFTENCERRKNLYNGLS